MAKDMVSSADIWIQLCHGSWNGDKEWAPKNMQQILTQAGIAMNIVNGIGDIGSLSMGLTDSHVDTANEHTKKLWDFCNAIHYEVVELVDVPFSRKAGDTVEAAYALNPENITLTKQNSFLGISYDVQISLAEIMAPTLVDDSLKKSFMDMANSLDDDSYSTDINEALIDALFWEKEFEKANVCKEIADQIFTPAVHANWNQMSEVERRILCEEYVEKIGLVLGEGQPVVNEVRFDEGTYSPSHGQYIVIDKGFLSGTGTNAALPNLIDAMTHEARHKFQNSAKVLTGMWGTPAEVADQWHTPYIEPSVDYKGYFELPTEIDARAFAALAAPA